MTSRSDSFLFPVDDFVLCEFHHFVHGLFVGGVNLRGFHPAVASFLRNLR